MAKVFYGGTVDKTVANSGQSVLVVKTRPVAPYEHCVVAFDGSTESLEALEVALWVAQDAKITIIHALKASKSQQADLTDAEDKIRGHVRTVLQEFADTNSQPMRAFELQLLIGSPLEVVLPYVRDVRPDIVAIGRTQKTGLKALVPGSNTYLLLTHLPCDTLIAARPKKSEIRKMETVSRKKHA